MKKFVFTFIFVLAFVGFAAATVSAESPVTPVIEGEMPNCYMPIGSDGITLSILYNILPLLDKYSKIVYT